MDNSSARCFVIHVQTDLAVARAIDKNQATYPTQQHDHLIAVTHWEPTT